MTKTAIDLARETIALRALLSKRGAEVPLPQATIKQLDEQNRAFPAICSALISVQERLDKACELLKAYERWEGELIMHGDWTGSWPKLTQELYDEMLALQGQRNAFLTEQSQ